MKKTYELSFISYDDLFMHVKNTVDHYRFENNLITFNKNLIDPIKMTFDSMVYNQDIESTIQNEVIRQIDRTNTNLIGYFHQNIFKYIGQDWIVPKYGFDIENKNKKIFVEMKNKHNTMNSSSGQKTFINMQDKIIQDPENLCLLVEVIAKQSQNIPWKISLFGESKYVDNIRRVSIDKFYELVTGEKHAFKQLCEILPDIIDDVVRSSPIRGSVDTVFKELKEYSQNIVESLYLLAFNDYMGFDKLDIK